MIKESFVHDLLINFFKNRTKDFFIEDLLIFFKKIDKKYYLINENEYEEFNNNSENYENKNETKNNSYTTNNDQTNNDQTNLDCDYFSKIKTYLINLDKRVDRLNETKNEFNKIGLNTFERFSGIIPSQNMCKECNYLKSSKLLIKNNVPYFRGVLGCKMSHLEILKKELFIYNSSLEQDFEYIMIVEDDSNFENNTIFNINLALKQLTEREINWDILYLSSNLKKWENATKISDNILKIHNGLTTTAQIFQKKNLEKIVNLIMNSDSEIDNTYNDYLDEKYCIYPMCVYQRRSYSDIQELELNYGHFHKKFIY